LTFTVVAPLYRNPAPIPELVQRLQRLEGASILLVEDGGRDEPTLQLLRELAGPRVAALLLARNVGQNRAIYAGLQHALAGPVVVMDADLQDQPEAIPALLAALDRWPAVFAQRHGHYQSWEERLTSVLFKGILRLASGWRLPADVGTFVAMRPEVVQRLLQTQSADPYLVGHLAMSGYALGALPFRRMPGGRSGYGWRGRFRLALRALRSCARLPSVGSAPPVLIAEKWGWVQ
jgi:polyisoprenyl-phosphate glycosyltransferase